MDKLQSHYYFLTPVGVIIGMIYSTHEKFYKLYDACLVTQEMNTSFVKLDSNDVILERITEEEYNKGVINNKLDPSEWELVTDGFQDKLTPLRPNIDIKETSIDLRINQIIAEWPHADSKALQKQLDYIMGRMPVKVLNESKINS